MYRIHSRHINFVLITGFIASFSYLLVATLTECRLDTQSGSAYLWSTPVVAVPVCMLLAFLYLPLGLVYAGSLLLIMRVPLIPVQFVLSTLPAFALTWLTGHLVSFELPSVTRSIGLYTGIDLTIIGWLAMIIYLIGRSHERVRAVVNPLAPPPPVPDETG